MGGVNGHPDKHEKGTEKHRHSQVQHIDTDDVETQEQTIATIAHGPESYTRAHYQNQQYHTTEETQGHTNERMN